MEGAVDLETVRSRGLPVAVPVAGVNGGMVLLYSATAFFSVSPDNTAPRKLAVRLIPPPPPPPPPP